MMRFGNILKAVGVLLLALQGPAAIADGVIDGPVVTIQFYEQHTGILVSLPQMIDPDNCGRREWFILSKSHPYYKEAYPLLLNSHLTGAKVAVHLAGCHEGLPRISHITSVKAS